jgi:hypothetical protein
MTNYVHNENREGWFHEAGCFTLKLATERPSEAVASTCYMKRSSKKHMPDFSSFPLVLWELEKMGGHMRSHVAAYSIVTFYFCCCLQHFMLKLHGSLKLAN